MSTALNVLMVEDAPSDVELVLRILRRSGYNPDHRRVDNADALNEALRERSWDIVLCDYNLPKFSGLEALRIIRQERECDVPFIFVTGSIGEEAAVDLMKAGAQDYVSKNNLGRLVAAIEREMQAARARHRTWETEKKLEFEQRLLRQLMLSTPDAIYFKDLQGRYMHLNAAECSILGIDDEDEALGKTAEVFIGAEVNNTKLEEEILSGVQPLASSVEKFEFGRMKRWYSTNRAPMRSKNGGIIGLVGVRHDITDHKLHEQMKDEFIATVNHELRTPLTSMSGALALLENGSVARLPPSVLRLLKIANANCQRLIRLVGEILDIGQLEMGKMIFNIKPLEIGMLLEQAIETNRALAEQFGVRVRLDELTERGTVKADRDRLTQAIVNILSNAVKFSPRGSEVVVSVENRGAAAWISVRDQGPGIPEEYRDRIFNKFVQVEATDARQKGGTGLGLSIVKEIVGRLGGDVKFDAAPGGGTIFHVVFPRHGDSVETEGQAADRPRERLATPSRLVG